MIFIVALLGGYQLLEETCKMVWHSPSLRDFHSLIHTVIGFTIVDETEGDDFLEFSCFLYDPENVGNLISGSSALSEPSLDIWKFLFA